MQSSSHEQEALGIAQAVRASIGAWEAREARPVVQGVCIDSDHSLDRDDAIWFEELPNGHLRVDITIADVASFISKESVLDQRARALAESEYGEKAVIIPMLPFALSQDDGVAENGILSLSDKGMRAGMTMRMVIDPKREQILSAEHFPSLIHPEICNYQQVAIHMAEQPKGRFAKWADYTAMLKRIRKCGAEGVVPFSVQDPIAHVDEEGRLQEFSAREEAGSRMVEEAALLANRCMAQLADACQLPWLYRVHHIKLEGVANRQFSSLSEAGDARQALLGQGEEQVKLLLDRAQYSPTRSRHAALGEYAYAHVTSPIRRYADMVDQRMQHWRVQLLSELAYEVNQLCPSISTQALMRAAAKLRFDPEQEKASNASKTLQWLVQLRLKERVSERRFCGGKIQKYASALIAQLGEDISPAESQYRARQLVARLLQRSTPAPYQLHELEGLARGLNQTLMKRKLTEQEKLAQRLLDMQLERELERAEIEAWQALQMDDPAEREVAMMGLSKEKRFPLAMHLAAQRGWEYRFPAKEILHRMEEGRLKEPNDLATILVQMELPKSEDATEDDAFANSASQAWLAENIEAWQEVKHRILQRFRDNPSFTKGFLKYLEERYRWRIFSAHASLIDEGAIAAVMSVDQHPQAEAKQVQFPPHFSIGHWGKTTRHHARIQLLGALAQQRLVPADQVKLPRPLKLMTAAGWKELMKEDSKLPDQIIAKAQKAGITLQEAWDVEEQIYSFFAQGSESDKEPIRFMASGTEEAEARVLALQEMMRSKLFRPVQEALFAKREKLVAIPIDADDALQWLCEKSALLQTETKRSSIRQYTGRREPIWQSRLSLKIGGHITREFTGESTQAEVADTFAYESALRYLRRRADWGDTKIEHALGGYEARVIEQYEQSDMLSPKTPYSGKMIGCELLVVEGG
jgi:hypothetical protein